MHAVTRADLSATAPTRRQATTGRSRTADPARTTTGGVVLGTEAAALRGQLDPTAWCALESVVAASDLDDVASVSVRSLAVELGVSKNTAQRALAALRAAHLITPLATRRDAGKFAAGAYRLAVPTAVLARVDASAVVSLPAMPAGADTASAAPSAPVAPASSDLAASRRARRSRVGPVVVEQLSLLPEV